MSPSFTTATLYLLLFHVLIMENNTTNLLPLEKTENVLGMNSLESKRQSIESARYSSETLLRDENIGRTIARGAGAVFGSLVLLKSVEGVREDIRSKKMTSWTYSRVILDFTASGALIGFSAGFTLYGIILGITLGVGSLITEIVLLRKGKKQTVSTT